MRHEGVQAASRTTQLRGVEQQVCGRQM